MEQKRKPKKRNAYFFLSNVFSFKNNFLFKSSSIFSQMFLQLSIWLVTTQMKEINMIVLIVGSLSSNKILIYIFIYIYWTLIYNLQLTDHRWDGCLLVQQTLTNLSSIPSLQPGATLCVCVLCVCEALIPSPFLTHLGMIQTRHRACWRSPLLKDQRDAHMIT